MMASDNMLANVQQRHFLSVAFNTHMASGPVVKWMAFREGGVKKGTNDPLLQGEHTPWQSVEYYDTRSRQVMRTYKKSRSVAPHARTHKNTDARTHTHANTHSLHTHTHTHTDTHTH